MENKPPLISVIIPTHNRVVELRRALNSLVDQEFLDFEVVICDDGSSDNIKAVVQEFSCFLNIRYWRIEKSGGPARPRNIAANISRGQWLSFLDSDDWWEKNRLQIIAKYLEGDVDVLYHRLRVVHPGAPKKIREKRKVIGDPINGDVLRYMATIGNPIPTSSVVFKKSKYQELGGMSEDRLLAGIEDFDFWLKAAHCGLHFLYISMCLGCYWVGAGSISNISNKQIGAQKLLYKRHKDEFGLDFKIEADSRQHYILGNLYLKMQFPRHAVIHFIKAKKLSTVKMNAGRWGRLILALLLCIKAKLLLKAR